MDPTSRWLFPNFAWAFSRKASKNSIKRSNALESAIHRDIGKRLGGGANQVFGVVATILIDKHLKVYTERLIKNSRYILVVIANRFA